MSGKKTGDMFRNHDKITQNVAFTLLLLCYDGIIRGEKEGIITRRELALLLACSMALSLIAYGGGNKAAEIMAASEITMTATAETAEEESRDGAAETTVAEAAGGGMDALIETAKTESEPAVHGSCEEEYLPAVCQNSKKSYGIKTKYQRLSASEVYIKISEEVGKPFADVWFGGTTGLYNEAVADDLLMEYDATNTKNLVGDQYEDPTSCWYGIYRSILGFMANAEELDRLGLEAPKIWDDLTKEEYKGLIMLSNPNAAGVAKLLIDAMVQMKGHDETMEYFKILDRSTSQYTKSGSGPSKMVSPGRCIIGIGFLHDGTYQILQGYGNIQPIVPKDGASFEVGTTTIFNGYARPSAAKLWIEYALPPDCVDHAKESGSYQFLVLSSAIQPKEATKFGLGVNNTIDYNFEDAKENGAKCVEDSFVALGSSSDNVDSSRFLIK